MHRTAWVIKGTLINKLNDLTAIEISLWSYFATSNCCRSNINFGFTFGTINLLWKFLAVRSIELYKNTKLRFVITNLEIQRQFKSVILWLLFRSDQFMRNSYNVVYIIVQLIIVLLWSTNHIEYSFMVFWIFWLMLKYHIFPGL